MPLHEIIQEIRNKSFPATYLVAFLLLFTWLLESIC